MIWNKEGTFPTQTNQRDQNMNDFPYVAFGHWPLDICPIQFFSVSFVLCNVNFDSVKIVHDKLTFSFNHEIE